MPVVWHSRVNIWILLGGGTFKGITKFAFGLGRERNSDNRTWLTTEARYWIEVTLLISNLALLLSREHRIESIQLLPILVLSVTVEQHQILERTNRIDGVVGHRRSHHHRFVLAAQGGWRHEFVRHLGHHRHHLVRLVGRRGGARRRCHRLCVSARTQHIEYEDEKIDNAHRCHSSAREWERGREWVWSSLLVCVCVQRNFNFPNAPDCPVDVLLYANPHSVLPPEESVPSSPTDARTDCTARTRQAEREVGGVGNSETSMLNRWKRKPTEYSCC